jgi:hypothetical protein
MIQGKVSEKLIPECPVSRQQRFCSDSRLRVVICLSGHQASVGHFATVATAISTPESCRSFEMVHASR